MVGKGPQNGGLHEENIARLEARFHAMLSMRECHKNTMARLGELKVISASSLTSLVDDKVGLRKFLKDALGLDPDNGFEDTLEQGKVVQVWEQAVKRVEVDKNAAGGQICYAFINGQPCKFTPCKFAHCSQVCEGNHPRTSSLCTGAGG